MKKYLQRATRLCGVAALFLCLAAPMHASALAEEGDQTNATTPAVTTTTETATGNAYTFTAKRGDSLTRMTRKALQLYQADKKITLSPAAAVYSETVIAQALGGSYLEIGQHVTIPVALVQTTADGSATLTQAQIAAWNRYASQVSFDVSDVVADSVATVATKQEAENKDAEEEVEPASNSETSTNDAKKADTYWWFIGAGVLVVIYFVLGGPTPRMRKK